MIRIRRTPARWRQRRYELELTPPDVAEPWAASRPLSVRGVSKALEEHTGKWHPADFWPLINEADALYDDGSDGWGGYSPAEVGARFQQAMRQRDEEGSAEARGELPPEPLTQTQRDRLVGIVSRRAPALVSVAEAVNRRWLTDEECEALSDVALGEFLAHLGPNDEPDREGREADDLLGLIEMQRRSYWQS